MAERVRETIREGWAHDCITANLKERWETDSTDRLNYATKSKNEHNIQKVAYANFGIDKRLSEIIISGTKESHIYDNNQLSVTVVEEKVNPKDNANLLIMIDKVKDHNSKQTEMKMLAYCEKTGQTLEGIGISKNPCKDCHSHLSSQNVSNWTV